MPTMTYLQAISDAMREEMRSDERVFAMGEDIGTFGGAFKVTDGFIDEFGPKRVMDTPLAESAIIGCAIGAAVEGLRPIAEMQFSDFISCGFDQLVNVAGKMYYRHGPVGEHHRPAPQRRRLQRRPVPLAEPRGLVHALARAEGRRAVDGRGREGPADRTPCATPTRSLFMEHKHLYRRVKGDVAEGAYETPFSARVAREGTDLTVIAYGAMVHTALEATEDLDGASVEVLDLRSLVPLDEEAILASVRKTSKVVIVDEANQTCAAGAQVAAIIAEPRLGGPRRPGRAGGDARRADPVLAARSSRPCFRRSTT